MKRLSALVFLILLIALNAMAEEKSEPGVWKERTSKGVLIRTSRDTNADGKPDSHQLLLKGRILILREVDSNFDGKIDQRRLVEWTTFRYGPSQPEIPGYRNLWREEDTDFDGIVDIYTERGQKTRSERIGKPMNTALTPLPEEKKPSDKLPTAGERLVDDRNERYGL